LKHFHEGVGADAITLTKSLVIEFGNLVQLIFHPDWVPCLLYSKLEDGYRIYHLAASKRQTFHFPSFHFSTFRFPPKLSAKLSATLSAVTMATLWEKAKEKLIQEIKDGVIKDDMKAADIHARDPVYKAVKIDNFKNNLRELRKRLKKFRHWADFDDEALRKDRELYPVDYEGRWGGSKAEELLREDMKLGVSKQMKPSQFWLTRDEYKCYNKDQFWKHIYQEKRSGKETMY
jgi:hypothetical protein